MHSALVCDKSCKTQEEIKSVLLTLGLRNVMTCNQRDNALELAADHQPDLVVLEAAHPVDGLTLVRELAAAGTMPTILLVTPEDRALVKQATPAPVAAFLAKPLPRPDATLALELAIHTACQIARLNKELAAATSALTQRKAIERAKGLLMEHEGLNEEQTYRRMRSQAMTRRISMAQLAQEILRNQRR